MGERWAAFVSRYGPRFRAASLLRGERRQVQVLLRRRWCHGEREEDSRGGSQCQAPNVPRQFCAPAPAPGARGRRTVAVCHERRHVVGESLTIFFVGLSKAFGVREVQCRESWHRGS